MMRFSATDPEIICEALPSTRLNVGAELLVVTGRLQVSRACCLDFLAICSEFNATAIRSTKCLSIV